MKSKTISSSLKRPSPTWRSFSHLALFGGILAGAVLLRQMVKGSPRKGYSRRIVILYKTLPQYRRRFFELVREELAQKGVKLDLVYGQPTPQDAKKKDTVELPWAIKRQNKFISVKGRQLYWQPILNDVQGADLVIAEQASKLLVNYVLLLRFWLGGERFAFWGHGKNFQGHDASGIGERLKRLVSTRVWWWFAYNETSAQVVRQLGFPGERITLVQNAIDTKDLTEAMHEIGSEQLENLRRELGINGNHVAVYAGGMYPDKRLDFLLEACQLIRRQIPDFHMLFIGSGIEAGKVRKAADQYPWIHDLGVKFDRDKVPYFSLSKVFLMPGLVGLAVLDSFALETPMVTTVLPYHSPEIEYLQDGVNGIVVQDSQSVQNYANAVIHLLQDAQAHASLVEGCRTSQKEYTVERMASNFVEGVMRAIQ